MVYYRAAPQVQTEGDTLKKVFEFKNTTKGRLYTNRLDLILEPLAAKYITYTIEVNGIPIYDAKIPKIKYSQLPIRNNIQFLERDAIVTIRAASTSEYQPILDFAIIAEFDFIDQPYPAAFIPFTNAELLGLSETRQIWNSEPFDQNFSERHYATIDTEGYGNLQLLIQANENYNPRILSNEHFTLARTFLDLFEGSYYGNVSALTRSPQLASFGDTQTNWNYADNSQLPTFQNNIETMHGDHKFIGKAPVKFDVDETGRFLLTPREFNLQVAMWIYEMSTPFDFTTANATGQLRRGWNVTQDLQPRGLEIIDLNNVLMLFQTTSGTPKMILYNADPHLDDPESTTISQNWEVDLTSKFTDAGKIQAIYIHNEGRKITILQLQSGTTGAIRAITLTSTTPYDFRTTGNPEVSEFEHGSDNITTAFFSRDGKQLLYFDTENKQLHKSTNLNTPYKLQAAITFDQTRHLSGIIPTADILEDLQYRFDGADLFISYYASAARNVTFRKYRFVETGAGWKLYSRDNIPFLPVGYRGNHITDKITIDLNNPEGQNRQYNIEVSDTSRLGIDITYDYPKYVQWVSDPTYTGHGRWRRRTSIGYFVVAKEGFRVYSNNIQTLEILGADTAEAAGTNITKVDDYAGNRNIEITTTAKFLKVIKTVAYEILHTSTFFSQRTSRTNSHDARDEAIDFTNTLPTVGFIQDPNRRVGYHDITPPRLLNTLPPNFLEVTRSDPITQQFTIDSLTRLPVPVTRITISIEAKKADGSYQTIIPDVGAIATLGETSISLSEQNPSLILPKGEDAIRVKLETDAQTILSLDAILSN